METRSGRAGTPPKVPRRYPLFWLLGVALLAVSVLGAGWGMRPRGAEAPSPGNLPVHQPASPGAPPFVVALGYVDVTDGVISLFPMLPLKVTAVPVHEADHVKAGDVLLKLDDEQLRIQVDEAVIAVQVARIDLDEAKTAQERHQQVLEQQKQVAAAARAAREQAEIVAEAKKEQAAKMNVRPEEAKAAEKEVARLAALEAAAQARLKDAQLVDPGRAVSRAELNVQVKEKLRDDARHALKNSELTAPEDGTVLRLQANPGEVFGPQSRQPALLFCPDKPRIVRAEVEQEFAARVSVGQHVRVADDSNSNEQVWTGKVSRVADWFMPRRTILPDNAQFLDVRTQECIIELDPGQPPPRIGQRVRVTIGG
jgi:multidrug resistance efflux pump